MLPGRPICGKCRDKIVTAWKPTAPGVHSSDLVGCEKLTPEKWEEGWRNDGDGWYQHNCPILFLLRIEDERKVGIMNEHLEENHEQAALS